MPRLTRRRLAGKTADGHRRERELEALALLLHREWPASRKAPTGMRRDQPIGPASALQRCAASRREPAKQ